LTDGKWDNFDVYKLLTSLPDGESGLIDIYSMICIGLLWCDGDFSDRVMGLYTILRDPREKNRVTGNSETWDIVFPRLIKIATIFTYEQMDMMQQIKYDYDK
jgi:hypothetical protein